MDKKIGFLNFGHWQPVHGSQVRTGRDALVQTVELAVAAEELGLDGAFVRVHHFARQLASPFPLLAAMAARTSRVEVDEGLRDGGGEEEGPEHLAAVGQQRVDGPQPRPRRDAAGLTGLVASGPRHVGGAESHLDRVADRTPGAAEPVHGESWSSGHIG